MGNKVSHGSQSTRKVILLDGSIEEIDNPLTVAELMLEYPQQVVVELNSAQKKPTPLPADFNLEVNKIYLMVPVKRGKPAHLSPQEAHHILLRANAVLRSKALVSTSKFLPFFAKICPASTIDESYGKVVCPTKNRILAPEEKEKEELVGFERLDYLSRTVSGKGWKPSLNTIEEKKNEMKRAVNLVILANRVGKRLEKKGLVWG
ncbi:uncharacterized protein LOC141649293 [Silene latifolia]|uniref:uncharacterized protein LOC141649293 n=1 Tax=Silene latifolia TaxID=37657 RepID=UPI003D779864